jgi:hypothetical protein
MSTIHAVRLIEARILPSCFTTSIDNEVIGRMAKERASSAATPALRCVYACSARPCKVLHSRRKTKASLLLLLQQESGSGDRRSPKQYS